MGKSSGWKPKEILAALGIAALAGAIAVFVGPPVFQKAVEFAESVRPSHERDLEEFRRGVAAGDRHRVYGVMQRIFPAEVAAFEDELVRDIRETRPSDSEIRARFNGLVESLLAANTHYVRTAETAAAVALFQAQHDLTSMLARVDSGVCAAYSEQATADLSSVTQAWPAVEAANGAAMRALLVAIESGRDTPQEHRPLSQAELGSIGRDFQFIGGDMRWLMSLEDGTTGDLPERIRCQSALQILDIVNARSEDFQARYISTLAAPPPETAP